MGWCHGRHALCSMHVAFVLQHQTIHVMPVFDTMLSAVSFTAVSSHCVPASTSVGCQSDVLTYVHLFQLVLHPAIGRGLHMVLALLHAYSLCVPASTPAHPVLAHGRSSLGQCWLSKESDALTYVHAGGPSPLTSLLPPRPPSTSH